MANINRNWDRSKEIWSGTPGREGVTTNWDFIEIIEEVISQGVSGDAISRGLQQLPKEKKKAFIRLIMEYNGIKIYDEKKEVKNIKAYANDVKLIAEEIKRNVQIIH
tara:strand:+ start:151 stop:471 length:321 start_codon:yes stop_codon:yes gene_type:complete